METATPPHSPRRRSVHWSDQPDAPRSRGGISPASATRARRRRDRAPLSAAATLSLYLSDALRDGGGTGASPTRRRHGFSAAARAALRSDDNDVHSRDGVSAPLSLASPPASPLSRFLLRRVHHEGAPLRLLQEADATGPGADRAQRPRALRLSSASASGSMERLLRETIKEAKNIREQVDVSPVRSEENRPPNQNQTARDVATQAHRALRPSVSPRLSREVPVPHPKPQRPSIQLPPSASSSSTEDTTEAAQCALSGQLPQPQERGKSRAARKLQTLWRRYSNQSCQRTPEPPVERDTKAQTTISETVASAEAEDTTGVAGVDTNLVAPLASLVQSEAEYEDGEGLGEGVDELIVTETAIQTEYVEVQVQGMLESEVAQSTTTATYHSATSVVWQDDEWSFLEEGRYATNELLDSSAHDEDTSIETLVWKRPHVAIELQEAKRRAAETTRRSILSKTKPHAQATALPVGVRRQARRVLVRPQRKHKQKRPNMPLRIARQPRPPRPPQSRVRPLELSLDADNEEPDSSDGAEASEQLPRDKSEDGVYAALLAQLHRYIDFTDVALAPESSDGDSNAMRNDLITIDDSAAPATWSNRAESEAESDQDGPEDALRGDGSSESDEVHAVRACAPREDSPSLRSEPSRANTNDSSFLTPRFSRSLELTEHAFQRTLARVQSRYALALQPLSPRPGSVSPPSDQPAVATASPIDTATQREFRRALDAFEQSLRASRASSSSEMTSLSPHPSPLLLMAVPRMETERMADANEDSEANTADNGEEDEDESDDGAVDAELETMLCEIRRCKQQIAQARRQSHV